jgi:pyruvate/2-oxoglutarate dehydrogenase complex dihydrolipoamide acyltransferase (E2) component
MIITVPQLGEGLREIFIIRLMKRIGENVAEDEPLYEAETEKSVVVIESPCSGVLTHWYVAEGEHALITAPVAEISPHATTMSTNITRPPQQISPRVRALAHQRQINSETLESLARSQGTLSEADLVKWCASQKLPADDFEEFPLSDSQKLLNRRGFGDSPLPVPATVTLPISWNTVKNALDTQANQNPGVPLTEFQVVAYAAASAVREHPRFRSRLSGRSKLRRYNRLTLGFAVKRGVDELVTAIVPNADNLCFIDFSKEVTNAMKQIARGTAPTADEATTLLISYMASYGITDAAPALTAPAVAVLFVGAPRSFPEGDMASLTLTFDHRIINGVGAALYLQTVKKNLASGLPG